MNKIISRESSFNNYINNLIAKNDLKKALDVIHDLVFVGCLNKPNGIEFIGSPKLDSLCSKIGQKTFVKLKKNCHLLPPQENVNIFIATRLEKFGGHTRLIKDYIEAFPQKSFVLLITDKILNRDISFIRESFLNNKNLFLEISPVKDRDKKLIWLQKKIITISPEKILLFNHNHDSPAISATQPEMNIPTYFIHHADHSLSLGLFLKHVTHIDLHKHIFNYCNSHLNIRNSFVPMYCRDRGARRPDFMKGGFLTSATVGGKNKIEKPYHLDYTYLIPLLLKKNKGKHIHIGKLSMLALLKIKINLIKFNVKNKHFVYIPWVPSVWEELKLRQVDLYINSFPLGGGLSTVEAMGAGIPLAIHLNQDNNFFTSGSLGIAYKNVFRWSQPKELIEFCSKLEPAYLEYWGKISRNHYLKYHNPKDIKNWFVNINSQAVNKRPKAIRKYEQKLFSSYFKRSWIAINLFKLRQFLANVSQLISF